MRESNYSFVPQNRATLSVTHMLYDRRALDTKDPLALLNNLTALTYLTQSSPRIREFLTLDGGLERLIDILRESCCLRDTPTPVDLWGLNGPMTARVINVDRQTSLKHSLAFQSVVNIGVRGSEPVRTRIVQAGILDLVAQILETWLRTHRLSIFPGPLGSQAAIDALARNLPVPGVKEWREQQERLAQEQEAEEEARRLEEKAANPEGHGSPHEYPDRPQTADIPSIDSSTDTDVDMDAEGGDEESVTGVDGDESMDLDEESQRQGLPVTSPQAGPSTTPRARHGGLPLPMSIPARAIMDHHELATQSSNASSSYESEHAQAIGRATSDNNLSGAAPLSAPRPPPLNLSIARLPQLASDAASNQSSPMGTPTRLDSGDETRGRGRRGTLIARPAHLAPRNERRRGRADGESGTSDGGEEDVDLPAATIAAGIAAANARALDTGGPIVPDEPGPPPNVEIVGNDADLNEGPDADAIAAEQARLDMEAGAPPGQPGAAQTPRAPPPERAPIDPADQAVRNAELQTQIIIANGAPRGFQDLGSYVGIYSLINPKGYQYPDDSVLLALQLLAYLSKYPHVRASFYNPRRPMHPTFDLSAEYYPLPDRPSMSQTSNIFSLVERFTFKRSGSDPLMKVIPKDIQYWAGVIMRNACRKDDANGGVRQCASMSCGRWETSPKEFAKCRRCRKAKYCSKECQSRAWSEGHRFWCATRAEEEAEMGKTEDQTRAEGEGRQEEHSEAPPVPEHGDMLHLHHDRTPGAQAERLPTGERHATFFIADEGQRNQRPTPQPQAEEPQESEEDGTVAEDVQMSLLQQSIGGPRQAAPTLPAVPAIPSESAVPGANHIVPEARRSEAHLQTPSSRPTLESPFRSPLPAAPGEPSSPTPMRFGRFQPPPGASRLFQTPGPSRP